jgi:hypothetical protein
MGNLRGFECKMMTHCDNIRFLSESVYRFLTDVFSHKLSFSELGITDLLIFSIAEYSRLVSTDKIEIYKTSWKYESIYGNDIDLFIQNNTGKFNPYALQAKVMSYSGFFKDTKIKKELKNGQWVRAEQQWEKLLKHEKKFGSKTYYLLYCGKPSWRPPKAQVIPIRKDCLGVPTIEELGFGIVERCEIENLKNSTTTNHGALNFKDVFPLKIDSLRKLFCCSADLPPTKKQYELNEIDKSGYKKIYTDASEKKENVETESDRHKPKKGNAPIRIIVKNG